MSNNSNEMDGVYGGVFLVFIAFFVWYSAIPTIEFIPSHIISYMSRDGNIIVISFVFALISAFGFLSIFDQDGDYFGGIACLLIVPASVVVLVIGTDAIFNNLLVTVFCYGVAFLTIGVSSFAVYVVVKSIIRSIFDALRGSNSRPKRKKAFNDFKNNINLNDNNFNHQFDYDARRFEDKVKQDEWEADFDSDTEQQQEAKAEPEPEPKVKPKPIELTLPKGVELRHPDDAKRWAIVDSENSERGERENALRFIINREEKRNYQAPIGSIKVIPYGVDKRNPIDSEQWLAVDNPMKSKNSRLQALRTIIRYEQKRAGVTNPNVEYI